MTPRERTNLLIYLKINLMNEGKTSNIGQNGHHLPCSTDEKLAVNPVPAEEASVLNLTYI